MPSPSTSSGGFTIRCPAGAEQASPVSEIRSRGNIPIMLENDFVVELSPREFAAGWRETRNLGQRRLDNLVARTAARIQAALDDDISEATPELAMDTTAFFLFSLRRQGPAKPRTLEPCELHWPVDDLTSHRPARPS